MENGSGVAEGDDQGGSPIISVGQDASGLFCTARLCSRSPATMEEVNEACPIQARALIPESQFGQGQLPAQINLASDGTSKEVLSECRIALADPIVESGGAPNGIQEYMNSVSFSSQCSGYEGATGQACRLLQQTDQTPPDLDDPDEPTKQVIPDVQSSPAPTSKILGADPGRPLNQSSGDELGDLEAVLKHFKESLNLIPAPANDTNPWEREGRGLYELVLKEADNRTIPIHPAQAAILQQQREQASLQTQAWRIQTYFAIGMAIATLITVIGTIIIVSKACAHGCKRCAGWNRRRVQEKTLRGLEQQEQARLKRAREMFEDMRICGFISSPPCVCPTRPATKEAETTNCQVGGRGTGNGPRDLETTRSTSPDQTRVQLQVQARLHDNKCTGWCQPGVRPDKITALQPVSSKIDRGEGDFEEKLASPPSRLPPATISELPTHYSPDDQRHLGDVHEGGQNGKRDICKLLVCPADTDPIPW